MPGQQIEDVHLDGRIVFLFCAGVVALRIDKGARRLWRATTVPAAN